MEKIKAILNKIKTFALNRRKRFYIILIVISSLVLLADLSVRLFVPDLSRLSSLQNNVTFDTSEITLPDTSASGDASDSAQDFSGGDMTLPDSDTTMQDFSDGGFEQQSTDSGTDASQMPEMNSGDMQGSMPDGLSSGDASQMPDMGSTDGSMTFPDTDSDASGDAAEAGSDETGSDSAGSVSFGWPLRILMGVRAAFWPIFIIAALIDALSIAMLVIIRRREKAAAEKAEQERIAEAFASDTEVHIARPEKKKKISPVTWILILAAIIVLVLIVKILSSATTAETSQTEATVYTAAVESGDIDTVLPGTGTLTEEDAVEVSLPSEVEILEWYVSDGDTVSEGDVLAQVDTDSALSAIASVQEVIASLDEALSELDDSDTTDTVTAAAGGRVKAVYAQEDVTVIDTIYESESLILLSLDGLMAVSFESEADVSVGDEVTVTLSDGTEEKGTIESAIEGTIVVTLTDEDTDLGDEATVTDADGSTLGTGSLYIHSELKVLAFSGTVSSVSVSVEDEVSSGDTLLSLTDVDNTFETALLVEQRSTLEEQMQTLFALYQNGYLYAEADGVISGLSSSSSAADSSGDAQDSSSETASETNVSASYNLVRLTETDTQTDTSENTEEDADDTSGSDSESEETSDSYANYFGIVTAVEEETVAVMLYQFSGTAPADAVECTLDLSESSTGFYVSADGALTEGTLSDIAVGDTLILLCSAGDEISDGLVPICVITVAGTSDASDDTDDSADTDENTGSDSDGSGSGSQNDVSGQTDQNQDASSGLSMEDASSAAGTDTSSASGTDYSSLLSEASSTEAAETAAETLTESVSTSYSVSETTLLSITPQDYVYVTITVDELDILSLETGLDAEVTLDAFPGQSFSGVVESIDTSGTNEGGNSKYTAVVRIAREENMLAGMNASVKITLDTAEDVLYVPAEAVFEEDGVCYVYTSYDEKTDTLGDPVEVETGVSDGISVEITSGLSEGDTYCYSVLDTVNYSTSSSVTNSGSLF